MCVRITILYSFFLILLLFEILVSELFRVFEVLKKKNEKKEKNSKKKEQKLLEKLIRNWGEKEGHVSASLLRSRRELFRTTTRDALLFLRAFFLSLFLSLKNGISLSLSFAFLSFYCALFERL